MTTQRIVGIVCLVVGVILWMNGMDAKDSTADQWSNFFTGHYTDTTAWYIIGGIALGLLGLLLTLFGGRIKSA